MQHQQKFDNVFISTSFSFVVVVLVSIPLNFLAFIPSNQWSLLQKTHCYLCVADSLQMVSSSSTSCSSSTSSSSSSFILTPTFVFTSLFLMDPCIAQAATKCPMVLSCNNATKHNATSIKVQTAEP